MKSIKCETAKARRNRERWLKRRLGPFTRAHVRKVSGSWQKYKLKLIYS